MTQQKSKPTIKPPRNSALAESLEAKARELAGELLAEAERRAENLERELQVERAISEVLEKKVDNPELSDKRFEVLNLELGTLKAELAKKNLLLGKMESFMGVSGLDPVKFVGASVMTASVMSSAELEERIVKAKTPEERHEILNEYRKALSEGGVPR